MLNTGNGKPCMETVTFNVKCIKIHLTIFN